MKKAEKTSRIFVTLILLVLAFLCAFDVTHSYFAASSKINGDLNFPDLNACFVYWMKDDSSGLKRCETTSLKLVSNESSIMRNEPFTFKIKETEENGGKEIDNLGIQIRSGSCYSYIRFWIDAYITGGDGTNYGKYFLFANDEGYSNTNSSSNTSWCYYSTYAVGPSDGSALILGNQLTFSDLNVGTQDEDLIPADVLGEEIEITISFQAVQSKNEAFSQVFNDEKGYYTEW